MTARIYRSFDLQMGVHFTGEFYMNLYDIDLNFNVETSSIKEQNIALDRIKYYLSDCLEHSVLVHDVETKTIEKYLNADMRVCVLPEEPYDQIVGIMLLEKLNAITEGRLVITDISIGSRMSDNVSCLHSLEDNTGPFAVKSWWNDSSTKINNYTVSGKGNKIVKLHKPTTDWYEVNLEYKEKEPFIKNTSSSEIVFANFDNKTDK
jgi:hypothetical protein